MMDDSYIKRMIEWRNDWNKFAYEVLKARLDREQKSIIDSVQHNHLTAVASGTARGKDYVSACAAMCFMYLTPTFRNGELVGNTKIALTAPTGRQVQNIMIPEITRLFRNAKILNGYLRSDGIQTDYKEWYLTGFKSSDENTEAWSGFHAVNTMFVVTEASGISDVVFNAIEGNLQGNSRLLIVFNPNVTTGYAARAMMSDRFSKYRLSSLSAENVVKKKVVIQGQVDYDWVCDKVKTWSEPIAEELRNETEGDFQWEGKWYRPNDLFRVKVLGMFPKVSSDVLIPFEWIEAANNRWKELQKTPYLIPVGAKIIGADVAGMGRDSSVLCPRIGDYVQEFEVHQSGGQADHMHVVGMIQKHMKSPKSKVSIDTIGEGAGVYSRLLELNIKNAFSCKFSEGASRLTDENGVYTFSNMRAYCYWKVRDWLDPKNGYDAAIPPCEKFAEEATNTKWKFQSNGSIIIEPKDDIKKRIKRSPDYFDALANTFYPYMNENGMSDKELEDFICN